MSKKTELINIFRNYKTSYNETLEKIKAIRSSTEYTEQGKEQKIKEILNSLQGLCVSSHDKAISLIDTAIENMKSKRYTNSTSRLNDTGYQVGLSNTIKMLEIGAIRSEDDIKNIVEYYKDDYNALSAIRNIISKNSNDFSTVNILDLIPEDNREKTQNLLIQLKTNIDNYISSSAFPNTMGTNTMTPLGIDGIIVFVSERLNDNLELI